MKGFIIGAKANWKLSFTKTKSNNHTSLQTSNKLHKCHHQKNCYVKTNVLLLSLRYICDTNPYRIKMSLLFLTVQKKEYHILKKKTSTRSFITCHTKCLVSNKTYHIYLETKKKKGIKVKRNSISILKLSNIAVKIILIELFKNMENSEFHQKYDLWGKSIKGKFRKWNI